MNPELPEPKKTKQSSKDKSDKSNKPAKRTPKVVKTPKVKLHTEEISQVEELIKQAFTRFYEKTKTRHAEDLEIKHLDSLASEYLENFMILGYDTLGQKVTIIHASTQYGRDALIEHLRSTLINILGVDGGI